MKAIAIAAVLALAGCETARTVAPHTTAGFEQGGIVGALGGASEAMLVTCQTLDGAPIRVAVDSVALATGNAGTVAGIRAARQTACAAAGAVHVISDTWVAPAPVVSVHVAEPAEAAAE